MIISATTSLMLTSMIMMMTMMATRFFLFIISFQFFTFTTSTGTSSSSYSAAYASTCTCFLRFLLKIIGKFFYNSYYFLLIWAAFLIINLIFVYLSLNFFPYHHHLNSLRDVFSFFIL